MRISEASIRGAVDHLDCRTPAEWGLVDVRGPFVLELRIVPPTTDYQKWQTAALVRTSPAQAALAQNNTRAAAKVLAKSHKRSDQQKQAEENRRFAAIRGLVTSGVQIFSDAREPVSNEELDMLFRAYLPGERQPFAKSAAAGYEPEDVGGPELLEALERDGEPLGLALGRFVQFWSGKAQSQQVEADEEEVLVPLAPGADSGPGNVPGVLPIRSARAATPGGFREPAPSADGSGSLDDADTRPEGPTLEAVSQATG